MKKIRIKSPAPTAENVAVGKDFASSVVMYHSALADKLGLNATDHKALDLVSRYGPLTAGQLAEMTGLTTGAITGILDRLARDAYVVRERDEADRRIVRVRVVPENRAKVDNLRAPMRQSMTSMQAEFSPQELESVQRYLRRVTEIMVAETKRLKG